MPMGEGTYGSKRGRPSKQSKKDKMDESKGMKGRTKGTKSKTKKGDKDFHEKGKDVKKKRSPYNVFMAKHRRAGKSMKEIGAMWRKMKK